MYAKDIFLIILGLLGLLMTFYGGKLFLDVLLGKEDPNIIEIFREDVGEIIEIKV